MRIQKENIKIVGAIIVVLFAFFLFFPMKYNELRTEWADCEKNKSCELTIYLESPNYETPNFFNMLRKVTSPFGFRYLNLFLEPVENDKENCPVVYVLNADYTIKRESIQLDDLKNISVGKKKKVGTFKSDRNYTLNSPFGVYPAACCDTKFFN